MKRIYYLLLVIIIAVISFKCQKEVSYANKIPYQANNQPSPIITTLQGNILDENGQPASGVNISVGSKITTTNSSGYFRIVDALLDKNASLVTAEQPGYFKAYRTFKATSGVNQVVIKLLRKVLAGTVNAATGGEVVTANGAKILLPANGVIKPAGGAYTGDIHVHAAYIDPTSRDISSIIPGSFMADDKDKNRVVLSSYGMLAVELESSSGEKLQLAPGSAATLTIPVSSTILSSAPASISLWYIDEQTGVWKEEGTARRNGNSYTGEVNHFSYWNCDIGVPAINFSAIFKTADNVPLQNMFIRTRFATDTFTCAYGFTDSLGQVSGLIPSNKSLVLEIYDQCGNVFYSKDIGPFSENTDLGTLVIPNSSSPIVTIKGKLLSCSTVPVSEGYVIVYFDNLVSYASVNAQGEFSTNIVTCAGIPQTFQILGVDETMLQQGDLVTIPFDRQVTDAGNIYACGVSTTQFIKYTLDGIDYTISKTVSDSLTAYSYEYSGTPFETYISGNYSRTDHIRFDFTGDAIPGVYALNSLNVTNYNRIGLTKPFNVIVTSFPKNEGEFYEGNFSGSFKDSSAITITHNINCSYRIKKQ